MKQFIIYLLLQTVTIVCLNAQNQEPVNTNDTWGDYYFINGKYAKAIKGYPLFSGELTLAQQRNLAQAFAQVGKRLQAKNTYLPVVNSTEASVEDYYRTLTCCMTRKHLLKNTATKLSD